MHHRSDYMTGKISFQQYYEEIAKVLGVTWDNIPVGSQAISVLLLDRGDENLNEVPLHLWDTKAVEMFPALAGKWIQEKHTKQVVRNPAFVPYYTAKKLRERGEIFSLGVVICALKAFAKKGFA